MLVCVSSHNLAHETAGAARTRHSLLPLFFRGTASCKPRADHAARRRSHAWKRQRRHHTLAVVLRESGGPSTPRPLGSITTVSGILDRPIPATPLLRFAVAPKL